MKRIQHVLNLPPHRILLVDDRPENVDAVHRAGFAGLLVDADAGIGVDAVDWIDAYLYRISASRAVLRIIWSGLLLTLAAALLVCVCSVKRPRLTPRVRT